jgi:multidrug efflux pump subunit AcrB
VSANVQGRSPGEVTAAAMRIAHAIDFPVGYGLELGGASRDQQEVFSEMFTALIMGIALMYLVLVMQFGSFTAPLPVMLSLPLSLIGVVVALLLTRGTLNLMSFIGVIMLMGLVAKNAILLLDCARKEEAQGVDREDALMHAGRVRLRPILMTTFALIAGMMPVAIGVVIALLLTGGTLNLMSFIGVIMLMGLVAKNAILLLDAARMREAEGMDREEALMAAGRKRLRPILMTTFALIAGMIPIAIGAGEGADFRAPLGQAVIGGVITSTILTLLVIPTFYEILTEWRDWMTSKITGKPVAHAHHERPREVPADAAPATRTQEA